MVKSTTSLSNGQDLLSDHFLSSPLEDHHENTACSPGTHGLREARDLCVVGTKKAKRSAAFLPRLNSNISDKALSGNEKTGEITPSIFEILTNWHKEEKRILARSFSKTRFQQINICIPFAHCLGRFANPLHSVVSPKSFIEKTESEIWYPEPGLTKKDHSKRRKMAVLFAEQDIQYLPEDKNGDVASWLTNELLSPYQRKTVFVLKANVEKFIEEIGLNNCGFLTLTFPDSVMDHKEANRRFDNLRRRVFPQLFGPVSIRVSERHKNGAWHFHVLVDCRQDIKTGINFDEIYSTGSHEGKRPKYSSASPYLRNLWSALRSASEKYGFGRTELLPIKSNVEAMTKYVGKYLSKGNMLRDERDKGVRLVGYRGEFVRSSPKMAWHSDGAQEWRRKLSKFSEIMGVRTLEGLQEKFGPRWAFHLKIPIMSVDDLSPHALPEIVRSFMSHSMPWKCPDHLEKKIFTVMDGGILYEKAVNFKENGQVYELF